MGETHGKVRSTDGGETRAKVRSTVGYIAWKIKYFDLIAMCKIDSFIFKTTRFKGLKGMNKVHQRKAYPN
jgi:hypothetical protein